MSREDGGVLGRERKALELVAEAGTAHGREGAGKMVKFDEWI